MENTKLQTSTKLRVTSSLTKIVAVAGLCVVLSCVAWILDRASIHLQLFAYGFTPGFYLNAIPVVLVFLAILALSNRVVLAFVVTLALTVALYAANLTKMKYLDVPIAYSDVYLLQNLHLSTIKLLSDFVSPVAIIAAGVIVAALIALSFWKEPRFFRRWFWPRTAVVVVVFFCLASIGMGAAWVGTCLYRADNLRVVPWSPIMTVVHGGLVSTLVYTRVEQGQALNEPVNQTAVNALLALDPGHAVPAPAYGAKRPDIIVIQSESFFDPVILNDVDNTDRLLPDLHRALARGIGGSMKPPTFGGGTLRTEFEVLTGIPMAAYPRLSYPYLQITRKTIPSIIHVANRAGYETIAIHANSGTFWNRDKAFRAIGFDHFITKRDFPHDAPHDGWYIDDTAMTNEIIRQLRKAHKPAFIFAVSIEAHGPYVNDSVDNKVRRNAIPDPPGMHGNALKAYKNYVYHIEDADAQMGRLWKYLAARKRPYILVFYGDHLAPLPDVYKQVGFDNGKPGPEQFGRWFIVGSHVQHRVMHVYSWMIGSELLHAAGMPRTPYYRLVGKAQRALAKSHAAAHRDEVMQGVYSTARLYLDGRLASDLKHTQRQGGNHVASQIH